AAAVAHSHSRTWRSGVRVRAASSADVSGPAPAIAFQSPRRSPARASAMLAAEPRSPNIFSANSRTFAWSKAMLRASRSAPVIVRVTAAALTTPLPRPSTRAKRHRGIGPRAVAPPRLVGPRMRRAVLWLSALATAVTLLSALAVLVSWLVDPTYRLHYGDSLLFVLG